MRLNRAVTLKATFLVFVLDLKRKETWWHVSMFSHFSHPTGVVHMEKERSWVEEFANISVSMI